VKVKIRVVLKLKEKRILNNTFAIISIFEVDIKVYIG